MVKEFIKSIRLIGSRARSVVVPLMKVLFRGSRQYWESRYATGGTSGAGSYGKWAQFKAEVLNDFVKKHNIQSVIEFGCGDGNQLSLADYPAYIGLDVSRIAIRLCKEHFKHEETKSFFLYEPDCFVDTHSIFRADLVLSLDVIYHLIEDRIFELYMKHLFSAAKKFVIIYSTDSDVKPLLQAPHIKHRHFSKWVKMNLHEWTLFRQIPNKYLSESNKRTGAQVDFFIYKKIDEQVV